GSRLSYHGRSLSRARSVAGSSKRKMPRGAGYCLAASTSLWRRTHVPIALTSMEQLLPFPTAEELTTKKKDGLVSVAPGTTVLTALGLMAEKHIGFLPVIENGELLGVLSERDCARRVVLRQLAAGTTTVREIMS